MLAATPAEPAAPALGSGSPEALYGFLVDSYGEDRAKAFWRWLTVSWPGWGRDLAQRLDAARAVCGER